MAKVNGELLLLHGAGLGAWIWNGVKSRLTVPAQALDLPGRGSGESLGSVTLRECVDQIVALMHAADAPPIIVAHSFSAEIALVAASEHPERVHAIVLVGGVDPTLGSRSSLRHHLVAASYSSRNFSHPCSFASSATRRPVG